MSLETGTYISDLVATNPTSGDSKSQGDDHLRLIKAALLATFPNVAGAISATHTGIDAASDFVGAIANGSITPTIEGETSAGTGTYSVATGSYVKVGLLVFVQITLVWTAHTGTGEMVIAGLPFAPLNVSNRPSILNAVGSSFTFSGALSAHTQASGSTKLKLHQSASNTAISGVTMDTVGTLYISGVYQAAS